MNELTTLTNDIQTATSATAAKPLLKLCTAITPQFYRNKSDMEIKAELLSIQLLTVNIEPPVLAKMCELAVLNYPAARSLNDKIYFDINYILTFFTQSFNQCCGEEVNLDGYRYCGYSVDRSMWVLNEEWRNGSGDTVIVRQVMNENNKKSYAKGERVYSSRYWVEWQKDNDARNARIFSGEDPL